MARLATSFLEDSNRTSFSKLKFGEMMEIDDRTKPQFNGEIVIKLFSGDILCLNDCKKFEESDLCGRRLLKGESVTLTQE